MKASDLSPRLLSFLCFKNHVGGRNDSDKKADVIFHSNIYLPHIKFLLFFTFLNSLLCSRTSYLLQVPFLCACPLSLKASVFSFFLLFWGFFGIPKGEVGLNICFNTWCAFNKSACQPYLPASLTVPFWRSWCTATRRLARLSQSLDLTIARLFSSLCLPWPWGVLLFGFQADSLSLLSLCKKKETSSVP